MSDTTWDITKQLPRSHDGTPAFRCDMNGDRDPRGKYICWYTLNPDGVIIENIAKIIRPKKPIVPLDYDKMKEELDNNPKLDTKNAKVARKFRGRLQRIFGKLGVQYLDSLNITKISSEVHTAAWTSGGKEEYILVNPYILNQRSTWVELLFKQQIIHRALSRGRENLKDRKLVNLVLDICANRLLAGTSTNRLSKTWKNFCQWLYPKDSKDTILALCNASLTPQDLSRLRMRNSKLADIWLELYEVKDVNIPKKSPKTGKVRYKKLRDQLASNIKDINPDDLYFRLRDLLTDKDIAAMSSIGDGGKNPLGQQNVEVENEMVRPEEVNNQATERSQTAETGVRKSMVPRRLRGINWKAYSDIRTEFWEKYVKKPEDIFDENLSKYAKKIQTQKVMENVAGRILENFKDDVTVQPYPHRLTEEGIMLHAVGMRKPRWPFYWNHEGEEGRRRIVVFFDLSPSMTHFFTHMMHICDTFEHNMDLIFARNQAGDAGVFTFAGSVRSLDKKEIEDMRSGKIQAGASTSYDSMVEYCVEQIETEDVDAVVCFTDGESSVSPQNIWRFNETGKKMYRVYMEEDLPWHRGKIIESSLDNLNGESYTLLVPKTDK